MRQICNYATVWLFLTLIPWEIYSLYAVVKGTTYPEHVSTSLDAVFLYMFLVSTCLACYGFWLRRKDTPND